MTTADTAAPLARRPHPSKLFVEVTTRCNLRCSYCNCPYIDPTNLDLPRIEVLFERLHHLGVRRLGLAGGEPMMRRDVGDIIALMRKHRLDGVAVAEDGHLAGIVTSGDLITLLERVLRS